MANILRLAPLDIATCLRDVGASLVSSRPPAAGVDVTYCLDSTCSVRPDQVAPLVRMAWELIANALSHAHPARVRGRLTIVCRPGPRGEVVIEVADDGVGLPEGFDAANDGGAGLRRVRTLGQRLGATLSFHSTGLGLTARIVVPTGRAARTANFNRQRNEDGRWRRQHEESL